jgi:uncharacterized protein (DUF2147 family)
MRIRFNTKAPAAAARLCGAIVLLAAGAISAHAQSAEGTWLRENGASRVKIAKCGEALCGNVIWLRDESTSKSRIGQKVFYDMKPAGSGNWSGKAFNPEDGKEYSGKMSVSGATLTTSGCVLGGLICNSVKWSRVD